MEAGQDEGGETGKHIRTSHAWAATRLRVRRLAAAAALLSPDPKLHLHPNSVPLFQGIHSALVTGPLAPT